MLQNIFGMVGSPGSALTLNLCECFLPKKINRMNKLYTIYAITYIYIYNYIKLYAIIVLIFKLRLVVITPLNENGGV